MDVYRYRLEASYVVPAENKAYAFRDEAIRSLVIDRDYDTNNMPILYLTMVIDKNRLDDMIKNSQKNLLNLTIYKSKKDNSTSIDTIYVREQFIYFILKDVSYTAYLDYTGEENPDREDVNSIVTIGLMKLDSVKKNKTPFNGVIKNTTMLNAITYVMRNMGPVLIEPLTYNDTISQIIVPPTPTISKTIAFLNNLRVFYNTPYRFFIDLDTTYILSSSGVPIPKNGSTINTAMIVVRNVQDYTSQIQGMITDTKQKLYQVDVSAIDTKVNYDKVSSKFYTNLSTTTASGQKTSTDLSLNNNEYLTKMSKFVQIPNDNVNMVQNLKVSAEKNNMYFVFNKNDIDASAFTPNMEFIVKNHKQYSSNDGKYLLARKREIFYREDKYFVSNLSMDLRFLAPTGSTGVKS